MKKNAFSLIEMLTVLIIMGVITIIGVLAFQKFADENKASLNSNLEKTIIDATNTYCTNPDYKDNCGVYPNTTEQLIPLSALINAKLLEGELKNNLTNKEICGTTEISVTPTSEYTYDYVFSIDNADYSCNP